MFELWKGISIPIPGGSDPSLVTLALRIFSICPNSASCERLFSSFGNILTKSRSRLSNKALVELAELKLHLQEEEIQSGSMKERVKRHFDLTRRDNPELMDITANSLVDTQPVQSSNTAHTEENESFQAAQSTATDGQEIPQFSQLISGFSEPIDQENVLPSASRASTSIPLHVLFNYSRPYWSSAKEIGRKVLVEELEVSEMAAAQEESSENDESSENLDHICAL